jgi:hypothetical protein
MVQVEAVVVLELLVKFHNLSQLDQIHIVVVKAEMARKSLLEHLLQPIMEEEEAGA